MKSGETVTERKIGSNVPYSAEETEEDLLEILYTSWQAGVKNTFQELCGRLNITRKCLDDLICEMIKHGYVKQEKEGQLPELTEVGKNQGAECLARHQYLASFLQMVCGLNEKSAEENACRIEHVVSGEVIHGVCEFLKYGDTYDHITQNPDLCAMYTEGMYEFCMGIYQPEQRYPRILAEEFYRFQDKVLLEIGKDSCYFYLSELEQAEEGKQQELWYKRENCWRVAKRTKKGIMLPAEAFTYTLSPALLVTECDCMIGFSDGETPPESFQCRELNIHIW